MYTLAYGACMRADNDHVYVILIQVYPKMSSYRRRYNNKDTMISILKPGTLETDSETSYLPLIAKVFILVHT